MSNLFSQVLNMSMTGSVVILLVILARLILKRAPKIFSYALWSVVLFRLLCPVAFTAPVSVLNALEPEVQEASESTSVVYFIHAEVTQDPDFTFIPANNQSEMESVQAEESQHSPLDLMTVASYVWLTGTGIMMLYSVIQYIRLRGKLVGAVVYRGNVYRADYIDTPFVMGIFSPKIYLPSDVPMNERKYIIAHERHHIRRCDHTIKLLAYLALCIHWFNPLVWAAFILAGKDMEMSCDEAVIRKMGSQIRADYSASLLRLATHKKIIAGMPLAFGEGDTKGRVMNMAKWKKPRLWVSVICLLLCTTILVACAVNPENSDTVIHTETPQPAQTKIITLENESLPNGYFEERDGDGNIIFTDGYNTVGGVLCYAIPEGIHGSDDEIEGLLYKMGIPDYLDPTLYYRGGMTATGGGWMAEFESNVPEGEEAKVYRRHHFYPIGDSVYDIWFDRILLDYETTEDIRVCVNLSTAAANNSVELDPTVNGSVITIDAELVQYGTLKMLLPTGFAAVEQDGVMFLSNASVEVGGIRSWNSSEFQPSDIVELKKEESGVPIGYMSTSSAYGDMEYEVFWDGNPDGLNEQHTFFIDGDVIYDVWYDQNLISAGIAEQILKTVAINAEPVVAMEPGEQEAFAKCRAVLEAVQKGGYKIVSRQINSGAQVPNGFIHTYSKSNEDWLSSTTVISKVGSIEDGLVGETYGVTSFSLCANGKRFSSTGGELVETANNDSSRLPWLADFTWDENIVAYMDTLTDENGECIMFRVDEQYIVSDEYDPHYFLFFNFDADGNFVNVKLQVNLFRDNEINITESIVSLDAEEINAEIQKEYQKAIE